jgi:cytochrome bd-type quinol oxidase subunit 2
MTDLHLLLLGIAFAFFFSNSSSSWFLYETVAQGERNTTSVMARGVYLLGLIVLVALFLFMLPGKPKSNQGAKAKHIAVPQYNCPASFNVSAFNSDESELCSNCPYDKRILSDMIAFIKTFCERQYGQWGLIRAG